MKYKTCVSIAEKTPGKTKKILKIALSKSDFAR
jgi:3-dehydroquinate dehydratase-1